MSLYLRQQRHRRRVLKACSGGGAASIADPTEFADLVSWFRSDLGTFQSSGGSAAAAGDPVGEWQDQYGTNHLVRVSADANRPVLTASQINGRSALVFDGSNDALQVDFANEAQPISMLLVCTSPSANDRAMIDGNSAGGRIYLRRNSGNAVLGAGGTELSGSALTGGNWYILGFVANGASSKVWVNGVKTDAGASVGANPQGGITLGTYFDGSSNPVAYKVAEVALYGVARTDAEMEQLFDYANSLYAIY